MHTRDMSDEQRLEMIARHIPALLDLTSMNRYEFTRYINSDPRIEYGVSKALELVGEAAYYMTPNGRAVYSEIDFKYWENWRHSITHAYDSVDFREVWETIWQKVPQLYNTLQQYGLT